MPLNYLDENTYKLKQTTEEVQEALDVLTRKAQGEAGGYLVVKTEGGKIGIKAPVSIDSNSQHLISISTEDNKLNINLESFREDLELANMLTKDNLIDEIEFDPDNETPEEGESDIVKYPSVDAVVNYVKVFVADAIAKSQLPLWDPDNCEIQVMSLNSELDSTKWPHRVATEGELPEVTSET